MNTKLLQVVLPQHSEGNLPGTLSIHSRQRTFDEPEEWTKEKQQPMLACISNSSMTHHKVALTGATAVIMLISAMLPPDKLETKVSFNVL